MLPRFVEGVPYDRGYLGAAHASRPYSRDIGRVPVPSPTAGKPDSDQEEAYFVGVGSMEEYLRPPVLLGMGDGDGDLHGMEGNCVRCAKSVWCWLQFVFTPGRLMIVLGWCLWTYGVRIWDIFLWVSFHSVLQFVVGDNPSLMGGE